MMGSVGLVTVGAVDAGSEAGVGATAPPCMGAPPGAGAGAGAPPAMSSFSDFVDDPHVRFLLTDSSAVSVYY